MEKEQNKNISKLIYKSVVGIITKSELNDLEQWKSEGNNLDVYNRIVDRKIIKHSQEILSGINSEEAISKILAKYEKKRSNRKVIRLYRYAAAILIPAAVIISVFIYNSGQELLSESVYENIKPGEPKAELILSTGELLSLSNKTQDTTILTELTQIKNLSNTLVYRRAEETLKDIPQKLADAFNTLRIPRGGEYKLELSDGTKVWVNSATELTYPEQFVGDERIVKLNGEAYFEVAENPEKPFIVRLNEMDVEVIGTSFNVMAYNDEDRIETTLIEGMVSITTRADENILLSPNQQAQLNRESNIISKATVDPEKYIAWTNKVFVFDNDPLEKIFHKLSRWYFVEIDYASEDIKDLHFTGYFERYDEIGEILDLISSTNKVRFNVDDHVIRVEYKNN